MRLSACFLLLLAGFCYQPGFVAAEPEDGASIVLRDCLVLPAVGAAGRSPVRVDPLEYSLNRGDFQPPKAGDTVRRHDGNEVAWRVAKADDGWVGDRDLAGGYLYWTVSIDAPGGWLLKARGHSGVYVNGELRGGDVYNYGYFTLPVELKEGGNQFLFMMGRGRMRAELERVPAGHSGLHIAGDWTLPDILIGEEELAPRWGSVAVANAGSQQRRVHCVIEVRRSHAINIQVQTIPPFSKYRLQFFLPLVDRWTGESTRAALRIHESADGKPGRLLVESDFNIRNRRPDQQRKVTFTSEIDGSVQYYAVQPAKPLPGQEGKPGIVLSLHGASVEATNQARAYSPKSWCHIVCPTNRRPFGFDWEDWGRIDALEVLEHAKATLDHDPSKVWLTGHSMGGHGAWTVGAHFPDKFAAVGPSAGWESFWSYTGGGGHPPDLKLSPILTRGANPSRTLLMKHNFAAQGIYILHGDADDNVPVREARAMREALKEFHNDLHYHEEPDAGHWWNREHTAGADCVDWPPMFDLFARRRLPAAAEVTRTDFTTVNPGNSDRCHWASIHMQQVQLEPSRIKLLAEPNRRHITGTTENVKRLRLDVDRILQPGEALTVELDGQKLELMRKQEGGPLWLALEDERWRATDAPPAGWKGPHRYAQLKNAMRNRFVLVYGTGGSEAENTWMLSKARYDAEQWQYRANGSVEVIPDSHFAPAAYENRDVILYGNADINSAFKLSEHAPVRLAAGTAVIGEHKLEAGGLALLYCYPRPDSAHASICVIGGTDLEGMKLTNRMSYFTSGAAFPDLLLVEASMLTQGTAGVLAAGYFAEDWSVTGGDFIWRDKKE